MITIKYFMNKITHFELIVFSIFLISLTASFNGCKESLKNPIQTNEETLTDDSLNVYQDFIGISRRYINENKLDSAQLTAQRILDFCERQESGSEETTDLQVLAYNLMAVAYQSAGQENLAIDYFHRAADRAQQTNNRIRLPDIYINLADRYFYKGDFPLAVDYYRKALQLSDSLNLTAQNETYIYIGLGQIYANLKNYKVADSYYQKVEARFDSLDLYTQYQFANNRGNYYYQLEEHENALAWFKKANRIIQGYPLYEAVTEANLAETFLLLNQPDSAQYYLDRAAVIFLSPESGISERFYINGLYASIALAKNDIKAAEERLHISYDMEKIIPTYIYYNNKRLEELYAKKGDYKKAYEYKGKAAVYNDSIINSTTQNNIAEIEMRYRQDTTLLKRNVIIAQREQQVAELQNANIILTSAGIGVVLLIIISLMYYKRKKDLQYAGQRAMITNLRMENVRNRISPHFMHNVLNAVLPSLRKQEELAKPLQLLVQSIRNNLMASEKIAVPLQEEINGVKTYIELLESVQSTKGSVTWLMTGEMDPNRLIPSACIQIPVENALKYAFETNDERNRVSISITQRKDDYLEIGVDDNGTGFAPPKASGKPNGTGNGLKILYKTIELLNTKNTRKIEYTITNKADFQEEEETGIRIEIRIPPNYKYTL
jgi:tetratricopeptide (TPR) repeat protein